MTELLREARQLAEAARGKFYMHEDGTAFFYRDQPEFDRLSAFIRRVDEFIDSESTGVHGDE